MLSTINQAAAGPTSTLQLPKKTNPKTTQGSVNVASAVSEADAHLQPSHRKPLPPSSCCCCQQALNSGVLYLTVTKKENAEFKPKDILQVITGLLHSNCRSCQNFGQQLLREKYRRYTIKYENRPEIKSSCG